MAERDFEAEFETLVNPLEEEQSEKSKWVEWHMYAQEDEEFRRSVIDHIARLAKVKTGRDLFDGQA